MSNSKKVAFCLAPMVHIYKRRIIRAASPFDENAVNAFTIDAITSVPDMSDNVPPISLAPLISFRLPNCVANEDTKDKLSITIPNDRFDDETTPVSYDNSPFSPNTSRTIHEQRVSETVIRKDALNQALMDFCNSLTPHSQRTPASVVLSCKNISPISLSPLSLSPKPMLPLSSSSSNL